MATVKKQKRVDINQIHAGDIFSETSHYVFKERVVENRGGKKVGVNKLLHLSSNVLLELDDQYVENLLTTADQFHAEVKVGKEDKYWTAKQIDEAVKTKVLPADHKVREGDVRVKGIRSIWASIYEPKVWAVEYTKANKPKSEKALKEERQKQLEAALKALKGRTLIQVTDNAVKALELVQNNPILDYIPGDVRTLRGYKIQFESINGNYDVIDMDLPDTDSNKRIRSVNVNQIHWLVLDGVKYIVE